MSIWRSGRPGNQKLDAGELVHYYLSESFRTEQGTNRQHPKLGEEEGGTFDGTDLRRNNFLAKA